MEQQLQLLDVNIVDVLAHLEGLLRHSRSIQQALLDLRRDEAHPPSPHVHDHACAMLTMHTQDMRREWATLGDIIGDLTLGVHRVSGTVALPDRRSGLDRRSVV